MGFFYFIFFVICHFLSYSFTFFFRSFCMCLFLLLFLFKNFLSILHYFVAPYTYISIQLRSIFHSNSDLLDVFPRPEKETRPAISERFEVTNAGLLTMEIAIVSMQQLICGCNLRNSSLCLSISTFPKA
jgi:hypothetical protein